MLTVSKIESIIERTVLDEIKSASMAANMPQEFIDNIKLKKLSDTQWEITNDWTGKNDEPLAVFFEYGTVDHYIEPKDKDGVLAFPSGGKFSGHSKAIYSKNASSPAKGNTIFSGGHWVTGLKPLEPMNQGFDIGIKRMREELSRHGR